ncbi:MAG: hypothetical protein J6C46_02895 [Clostridia bacterium]|nr:hypothetical protein [Clostridia bacterium]
MEYKCFDKKYTASLCKILETSISENNVYNVFLGEKEEYRLINKDSFITSITDMRVFLEYGVYPLVAKSTFDLEKVIYEIIDVAMSKYEKLLPLYQTISLFYEQDLLLDTYEDLPLVISIDKYKTDIIEKVQLKKIDLENYKGLGFDSQINSMYEMIIGMINNSKSFM